MTMQMLVQQSGFSKILFGLNIRISDFKCKVLLKSSEIAIREGCIAFQNGNWKIVVSSGYKRYTYETVPADVKAQYEADCK